MKPVLALDADNVLLRFSDYWHALAQDRLGRVIPEHREQYHFMARHELTREEYNQVWDYFREKEGWSNVPFYPGVGDVLDVLAEEFSLVVVTGIPDEALAPRQEAFRKAGLPVTQILATGHRDTSKSELLAGLNPVAFIDDRPLHLQEAASAGVRRLFWVDQGYDTLEQAPPGTTKVSGVHELISLL